MMSQQGWEQRTEWPMAGAALAFLVAYSVQVLVQPTGAWGALCAAVISGSWILFVVDYFARLYLAERRLHWFFRHLLEFVVVVLPAIRPLRLLRLVAMVTVMQRAIGGAIRGKVLIYTIATSSLLIYVASLAMLEAERGHPDATVNSFGEALWWSMTTVTTVGYGDYSPVTTTGRFIAAGLMIGGISLIGVVTATIASWIVEQVAEEDSAKQAATAREIEELRYEVRRLTDRLPLDPLRAE
ncbi:potassium channel family protein [Rhodococcus sp. NPDC003318]|uniref:potassium channel family protein n=1 Tax=Rhodococcus sp. NPDC003318 TaxID=3364503 RepID=UPI0036C3C68A